MWSIPTKKFSAFIRFKRLSGNERGQTMLEYVLVIAVVFSIFIFFARPFMKDLNKKFEQAGKSGFFAEDQSGSNFYYFPLP